MTMKLTQTGQMTYFRRNRTGQDIVIEIDLHCDEVTRIEVTFGESSFKPKKQPAEARSVLTQIGQLSDFRRNWTRQTVYVELECLCRMTSDGSTGDQMRSMRNNIKKAP